MNSSLVEPFIISTEIICDGVWVAPIGIELADSVHQAFRQAIARWPQYNCFYISQWEKVPSKIRLIAIELDRR